MFKNIIAQYYSRRGNRIVFTNGMSLSDIASIDSETYGTIFDTAALSRILNGTQIPHRFQIRHLCDLLDLSESDFIRLSKAALNDLSFRLQFDVHLIQVKDSYTRFLEFIVSEPHSYIDHIDHNDPTVREILDILDTAIRDRFPTQWSHQSTAYRAVQTYVKDEPQPWVLYKPQ